MKGVKRVPVILIINDSTKLKYIFFCSVNGSFSPVVRTVGMVFT